MTPSDDLQRLVERNRARVSLYAAVILAAAVGKWMAPSLAFVIICLWALMLAETVDDLRARITQENSK